MCVLFYSAYTYTQQKQTLFKFKITAIHAWRGRYIFIHWQLKSAQTQIDACAHAAQI